LLPKDTVVLNAKDPSVDLIYLDGIWVPKFVEEGWVLDITDRITPAMKDDLFESALYEMTYKGKIWGTFPGVSDNTHFYSNTRMLEEAGIDEPPKTWFELVEQCEILKQKKISEYPLLVGFEAAEGLIAAYQFPIVWTFGGEFFDEDLNPIMNSAEAVEGITWLTDLWRKHDIVYPGALTETEHDIAPIFARGESAFMWTWTYYVTTCLDPSVSTIMNEFDTFITPGTEKLRSANASTEWMVPCPSPFSKHIEEAFKFAEYFASPENTKRMLIEARIVSAWKSVYEDPEVQAKVPHFDTMMESMKWAKPRSLVPWYPEFSDMITKEQHNAWAGKITPQEMMDKIAKQCSEWKKDYE
jgi:multiple sugar transport system substrate-binding protein